MSRTTKWEHQSDSYRVGQRLDRKARPAGRDAKAFYADLEQEGE